VSPTALPHSGLLQILPLIVVFVSALQAGMLKIPLKLAIKIAGIILLLYIAMQTTSVISVLLFVRSASLEIIIPIPVSHNALLLVMSMDIMLVEFVWQC